jgi:hypothetical protein
MSIFTKATDRLEELEGRLLQFTRALQKLVNYEGAGVSCQRIF